MHFDNSIELLMEHDCTNRFCFNRTLYRAPLTLSFTIQRTNRLNCTAHKSSS